MKRIITALLLAAFAVAPWAATAEVRERGFVAFQTEGDFESVAGDLEDAIINSGLVIDYTGYINNMLERTADAAESVTAKGDPTPFSDAIYMHFCSAKLTHEAVSANPQNIAICPYVVFVYEERAKPGVIHVGYRRPVAGPSKRTMAAMAKIEALLEEVVKESLQ